MGRRKQPLSHTAHLPLRRIQWESGDHPPAMEAVHTLAGLLERQGLRRPVLVTREEDNGSGTGTGSQRHRYTLVVGRKRLLAARHLGWESMDCILLGPEFSSDVEVISRLQKGESNPWELAATLRNLKERCDWTQAQLGAAIGKTRDFVANYLALTGISADVRAFLRGDPRGETLSARHLRFIGRTPPAKQMRVAREILADGLSTKTLEQRQKNRRGNRQMFKVRGLRQPGTGKKSRNLMEWRKYYRQISTDLKRLERKEHLERKRAEETLRQTRLHLKHIKKEARLKRNLLRKELRRATQKLARAGR